MLWLLHTNNVTTYALAKFQISKVFLFLYSLEILCFLGDGSFSPPPLAKQISMYLVENMFEIVPIDKHPTHFLQGNIGASTSKTI
jgi:hypothetical protein